MEVQYHCSLTPLLWCRPSSESSSQALSVFNRAGLLDLVVQCLERHPDNVELATSAGETWSCFYNSQLYCTYTPKRVIPFQCSPLVLWSWVTDTVFWQDSIIMQQKEKTTFWIKKKTCLNWHCRHIRPYMFMSFLYSWHSQLHRKWAEL